MDRKLFTLLIVAYFSIVGLLLELSGDFIRPEDMGVFAGPVAFLQNFPVMVGLVSIFILPVLAGLFAITAIADAVMGKETPDGRYFTRCFIYRTAFLLWLILLWYLLLRSANQFAASVPGGDDHSGDMLIPLVPAVVATVIMNFATSLHVISGLAAHKKQRAISGGEFSGHIFLQLFFGFDFIDSLFLMFKEKADHPGERTGFFRHVFVKSALPAPGTFGALLGIGVLASLWMLLSFNSVGTAGFLLNLRNIYPGSITRLLYSSATNYFFLFVFSGSAVLDASRFFRKPPKEVLAWPFLKKVIAYSAVALALEITLFALILLIVASLVTNFTVFLSMDRSDVIPNYFIFIVVNAAAIAAVQVSAAFYSRLVIKRSQTDGVITEEEAAIFKRQSLYPWALVIDVYHLNKAIREHEEASRIVTPQNWL